MTSISPTPLISVILAVRGVEDYVAACLDSVLGQPFTPVEVIAVDDASGDACGPILDERAARDPRLRVIHLSESVGPGPARMRGLRDATAEYVWFVDPDDLVAGGALASIARALTRDRPDVMLLDYLILHASGRLEPSPGRELLEGPAGAVVTLAERPALIDRTMTSWSKVIRRGFLTDLKVPFPAGIHEDVLVSCAVLLGASRISLLGEVCYLYRRRERSFLSTPGSGHFSIFSSYASVFAFMDAAARRPGIGSAVRSAVFGRAMEHYTSILANGLVPPARRREFFHRMAEDYRRYLPRGYRPPSGPRGMKIRLIGANAYAVYALLEPLNRGRVALRLLWRGRRRHQQRGGTVPEPSAGVSLPDHGTVK